MRHVIHTALMEKRKHGQHAPKTKLLYMLVHPVRLAQQKTIKFHVTRTEIHARPASTKALQAHFSSTAKPPIWTIQQAQELKITAMASGHGLRIPVKHAQILPTCLSTRV
jgi:hypothetical protein